MFINKKVNFGLSLFLKGKKMPVALFVEFEIKPQLKAAFVKRVCEHRNNVLSKEKHCQQFDVLIPEEKENSICLYEVYNNAEGFKKHTETPHMKSYRRDTQDMIVSRSRLFSTVVK